jgi:hypothetical protein
LSHRPDKLGLMFWNTRAGTNLGHQVLVAYECWEGAAADPKAAFVLKKLSVVRMMMVKLWDGTTRVIGPRHEVEAFRQLLLDLDPLATMRRK